MTDMSYAYPNLLTRQELADRLGMSYDSLYRNEERLGLVQARVSINQRVLYYREDLAVIALVRVGLIVVVSNGTATPAADNQLRISPANLVMTSCKPPAEPIKHGSSESAVETQHPKQPGPSGCGQHTAQHASRRS